MIFSTCALAVAPRPKNCAVMLLVEPAEKSLETLVGLDFLDGVKFVTELVVRPGFVDEIFATMAGGRHLASALAARDDVVSARGDVSFAKDARIVHTKGSGSSNFSPRQFQNQMVAPPGVAPAPPVSETGVPTFRL